MGTFQVAVANPITTTDSGVTITCTPLKSNASATYQRCIPTPANVVDSTGFWWTHTEIKFGDGNYNRPQSIQAKYYVKYL